MNGSLLLECIEPELTDDTCGSAAPRVVAVLRSVPLCDVAASTHFQGGNRRTFFTRLNVGVYIIALIACNF